MAPVDGLAIVQQQPEKKNLRLPSNLSRTMAKAGLSLFLSITLNFHRFSRRAMNNNNSNREEGKKR